MKKPKTPLAISLMFRAALPVMVILLVAMVSRAMGSDATKPTTSTKPAAPAPPPKDAWKLLPGWQVEVLAEKPTIHYPSVVCCAPDGRIFMAEDPMDMKGSSQDPADRILVYHPETGKFTVFADKLYAVFGLQYIDGKLYVHHTPKFSVFTDHNSVGVDRVDLISSDNPCPNLAGAGFNDHIPSGCRLAMDGYLYITTGDKGIYGAVSNVDHSTAEIHGGGIIRIRPDGTGLEVYCTGTRNHLDVAIDDQDSMFTYDNTDDGLGWWTRFTNMVDGGYYGYPFDYRPPESEPQALAAWNAEPGQADHAHQEWEKANKDKPANTKTPPPPGPYSKPFKPWTLWRMEETGGGAATGITAYNEGTLPDEFHGNVFACEWGKGQMERFVVARSGGTYKVIKRDVLLGGGPEPLRPVGVDVLQDGSGIVVTDWNYAGWRNPNVDSGRLLKVTFTGPLHATTKPSWYVPAAEGQPFEASVSELIAALSHPSESVRLVAQRRLVDRGESAIGPLEALLRDPSALPYAKWHAIWTLDALIAGAHDRFPNLEPVIIGLLQDTQQDVTVRIQAARQVGTRRVKEAVPALIAALNEDNESLRFASATALGRIGDVSAVQPLIDHLSEPDLFTHFAIFTALNRIGRTDQQAWKLIVTALARDQSGVRPGVCLAMHDTYEPALLDKLASFINGSAAPEARVAAVQAIAPLQLKRQPWTPTTQDLKWWRTMPARNAAPPRDTPWSGTATVMAALQQALGDQDMQVRHAVIAALSIAPNAALSDRLAKLFDSDDDVPTCKEILAALASAKAPVTLRIVREVLQKGGKDNPLLNEALESADQIGGAAMAAMVAEFVSHHDYPAPAITAALEALVKLPEPESITIVAARLNDPDNNVVAAAGKALGVIDNERTIDAVVPYLTNHRTEVKRATIEALGAIPRPQCVSPLLAVWRDPSVQKEAILALAAHPDVRAMDAYWEGLGMTEGNVRARSRQAVSHIHEAALPLIDKRLQNVANPPAARAVAELQQEYERFIPAPDRAAHKLYQFDTKALSPEAFANFAHSHSGEAAHGNQIFHDANGIGCIKCHKIANQGGEVGPSLVAIGGKYPREFIIESILYPSKQIADGYAQTIIKRKSTGMVDYVIIRSETDTELTATDSSGQKVVIKKADIATRRLSPISMMPEGLQTAMKPEDFADLVAYLESLKK